MPARGRRHLRGRARGGRVSTPGGGARRPPRRLRRRPGGGGLRRSRTAGGAAASALPRERAPGAAKSPRKTAWLSQIRRSVRVPRFREAEYDVRRRQVTKQDFVDAVADRAGISKREAG